MPDLRLEYSDPYTSRLEDAQIAEALAERAQDVDLGGLLREHWRMTDKPEKLIERFVARDIAALEQAESYVDAVERRLGRRLGPGDRVLEVGCGTAALAAVVARRESAVVASDVSMRWLVLAKKRLEELGLNVELACCCAEALPFGDGAFDLVIAGDVVEHVADQRLFVLESARVLAPGGLLFLATPNRYSLGLEPHVRLWGVGLLPRRAARWYVERVRGTPYDHVRLLSSRTLRRLLEGAGLRVTIESPAVPEVSQRFARGFERRLMRLYNAVRGIRVVRSGLLLVGPFFHVFAVKDEAQ
ncbi:MAG: methylase involved in ubiquinone/menaquinone biosynthesis [Thermoleophilia bacterium]|nr:methylase involved in ubiquinone/menaquinone biosynthesis [Thermoleophilia bacterium]